MIALSTAWNADKGEDGAGIAQEIFSLGVRNIELNFSLTRRMVEEIAAFAREHTLRIESLHNYCPIPDGTQRRLALPDFFSLAALDEEERKKAVACTKTTIATASRLKARAVVLHAGRVEMKDKTRELIDLCRQDKKESAAYKDLVAGLVAERKQKAEPHVAQILKSLEDLSGAAREQGVVLGIENRFYYREIPSLDEFKVIFSRFKDPPLAYWHDVGHSFIFEKLGLLPEGALLENFHSRLFGMHLHNIKDYEDHQAIPEGEFDFTKLLPFVNKDTLLVLEAHGQASAAAIKESRTYLEGLFHA